MRSKNRARRQHGGQRHTRLIFPARRARHPRDGREVRATARLGVARDHGQYRGRGGVPERHLPCDVAADPARPPGTLLFLSRAHDSQPVVPPGTGADGGEAEREYRFPRQGTLRNAACPGGRTDGRRGTHESDRALSRRGGAGDAVSVPATVFLGRPDPRARKPRGHERERRLRAALAHS